MPLGIQRFNAHQTHPNDRIIFIKPLPGPTSAFAQDFLSRIAAICKPIMTAAHLSVTTLEEYEPNPEFVGRNFNAGEIIQLVLKAPRTGQWLSFRSVQMVMMHELAHCVHMNHGRAFWKSRNQFAGELRELWGRGYTGDGFWGRGKTLLSEGYEHGGGWEEELMPERLCGGTFKTRRGRKRKRGGVKKEEGLTHAERRQRRIEKKFGKDGKLLGAKEEVRVKLENGKKPKGKPRVAGSARGRELRAAAALARFGAQKEEEVTKEEAKDTDGSESGTESDMEDVKPEKEALDLNGSKLLDSKGRGMVKVCEDEDQDDIHVKQEMDELHDLALIDHDGREIPRKSRKRTSPMHRDQDQGETVLETALRPIKHENSTSGPIPPFETTESQHTAPDEQQAWDSTESTCLVCSMTNDPPALVCVVCANVLQPQLTPGNWQCPSSACEGSKYINAGDCGICGACGAKKPAS